MINVGSNFGRKDTCKLCKMELDNQEHIIQCSKIKDEVSEVRQNYIIKHDDIYSKSFQKKKAAVKLYAVALRKRKEILNRV